MDNVTRPLRGMVLASGVRATRQRQSHGAASASVQMNLFIRYHRRTSRHFRQAQMAETAVRFVVISEPASSFIR
jgi:hypothetical protein